MSGVIQNLKTGERLTADRVRRLSALFLAVQLAFGAFFLAGTHGWIVPLSQPISTDFVSFYAAGALTLQGTPERVYDPSAHHAAEIAAREPGLPYNFFFYPPVYLLICALLAALPYLPAFLLFEAATLAPCLIVGCRILGESGPRALLPLLAFPAVFWTIDTGQNAFLSAALLGGGLLLLERKPVLAGLLLGALCYKPHFGLLVAVALLAGRHWRATGIATLTVAGLVLLSFAMFGAATWHAFVLAASGAKDIYATRVFLPTFTNLYGPVLTFSGQASLALGAQLCAFLALTVWVGFVWTRRISLPLRAAALAAATPLAVPVSQFYDLILSGLALLWLIRDARAHGYLPYEKSALAALFLGAALSGNFGLPLPVATATALGVFLLSVAHIRRALRAEAVNGAAPPPAGAVTVS